MLLQLQANDCGLRVGAQTQYRVSATLPQLLYLEGLQVAW